MGTGMVDKIILDKGKNSAPYPKEKDGREVTSTATDVYVYPFG
jgi:hypothetical protein